MTGRIGIEIMHTNSTTVICFQKKVAVDQSRNVSQDNSTHVLAVVRTSPKSQLWIPYVLIGFGCVVFLAVHFWCYHKRNRARYLRKREEIRVKCGLLERRRITTLMMAMNQEELDAESNTKEENEENALLAAPFYSHGHDNDYFRSQQHYYETLLDKKAGIITKPHIGCCLSCSVSMPAGIKTSSTENKDKGDAYNIHQSRTFCNSKFDSPDVSSNQMSKRVGDSDSDCYKQEAETESNAVSHLHNDNNSFQIECHCISSEFSSTGYANGGRHSNGIDIKDSCNLTSESEEWIYSAISNDLTPVEGSVIELEVSTETNPFVNFGHDYKNNQLFVGGYKSNEIPAIKPTDEVISKHNNNNNGQPNPDNIAPQVLNPMSDNDNSIVILSRVSSSHFNKDVARPGQKLGTNNTMIQQDETLDTTPSSNANNNVNDSDDDVDYNVPPTRRIQSEPAVTNTDTQTSLKTPPLRSLNPRLVFENLHHNAK